MFSKHYITKSLKKSDINLWYLNDGTLGADDKIYLKINLKKCEISLMSSVSNLIQNVSHLRDFISVAFKIKVVPAIEFSTLGCSLVDI